MDGFGDNFTDPPEVDPAAEFLAREQDELAGLEVEIPPVSAAPVPLSAQNDDSPGLLENLKTNGDGDTEGSFEIINTIDQSSDNQISEAPAPVKEEIKEEPEKIKKWREQQKARLEEKDTAEEKKKEEAREVARKELEEWYKHHTEAISKTKAANRESAKNAEKQFVAEADEIEPGTEWERIVKLCDFNTKSSSRSSSKDVSRMRSIILQLKQNPNGVTNSV